MCPIPAPYMRKLPNQKGRLLPLNKLQIWNAYHKTQHAQKQWQSNMVVLITGEISWG